MTLPCSAGAEWNIWIKTKAFMKWVLVLAKGKVNEHRGKKHPPLTYYWRRNGTALKVEHKLNKNN